MAQAYQTQSTDPTKPYYVPKSILGYDPTQAYQGYLAAMNNAPQTRDQENEPLPFNDWFMAQAQNSGTYGIANLIVSTYVNATGQEMSSAQQQQMYRIINSLTPTAQQELLAAGGTDYLAGGNTNVTKLLGQLAPLQGFLYGTSGGAAGSQVLTQAQSDAQSRARSLDNSLIGQYQQIFGHEPSASQLAAMRGMNESDLTNYLNNQPFKLGLTFGQWDVAQKNINSQYMKYFGRNATDQEVAWANGKSQDDIQSHIMDSPSRVDGLKMGNYIAYKDALDTESTKMFGYAAPDEMIHAFSVAQNKEH